MNIYRKANGEIQTIFATPINKGCERKWELQGDDYITLRFNVSAPIVFKIGDYTEITEAEGGENGRFYITESVKPSYNKGNGAYTYEIKFEAEYKLWNNYVNKYITSTAETNWKLTGTMNQHLDQILRNLDALGLRESWRGTDYYYSIDWEVYDEDSKVVSGVVSNEAKYVEYANTKICDALTAIADAWECEWWVQDNCIYFGYCEHQNIMHELRLGGNVESWDIEQSSGNHANRIYVFGSTRNIPSNYRRSLIISPSAIERPTETFYRFTDNVVKLSLGMLNARDTGDIVTYMRMYSRSSPTEITPEQGYNKAFTSSTIYHYMYPDNGNIYAGMPHQLLFGSLSNPSTSPYVILTINNINAVDEQYVNNPPNLDIDEYRLNILVRGYLVSDISTKMFEVEQKVTYHAVEGIAQTINVPIPDIYAFNDGTEFGLDIECHVAELYGCKVGMTRMSTTNIPAQKLLAKQFYANLIGYDSTDVVKDNVIFFCAYQGLSSPAEADSQNVKWAYAYDQQQIGVYYTYTNPKGKRILIPRESLTKDVPMAWYTDDIQSDSLYAITEQRLMLPKGVPYIQAEGLADNEVIEDVVTLDDVYPRMKDMTIGKLLWHEEDGVLTTYEDGTQKTERYKAYYFRDSIFVNTGSQTMKKDYTLAGQTARVRFGSGRLNGMEFNIELESGYTDEAGTTYDNWNKIIRNEDYGPKLPNSYLYPEVGDKIIYLGWDEAQMGSTGYVDAAEQELYAKGKEYLDKARINDRTYNITLMEPSRYGVANILESQGKNLKESEGKQLQVIQDSGTDNSGFCKMHFVKGRVVKICDETATIYDPTLGQEVPYRISRVIGYTYPLDIPYDHPTIKVGVSGIYSRLADIENKLRKSKNNG